MSDRCTIYVQLWALVIALLLGVAILFFLEGFRFSLNFFVATVKVPLIAFGISCLLNERDLTPRFAKAAEGVALMSVIGMICLMLTYLAATGELPLVDRYLLSLDEAMLYDWKAFARFAATHSLFDKALYFSYNTNIIQPVLIVSALCLTGRETQYQRYAIAMLIGGIFTAAIFFLLPATTAWTYLGQERLSEIINPDLVSFNKGWIQDLKSLRSGGNRTLDWASGIVAFPSHHCLTAALNVWACWSFKYARYPALVLNIVMMVSAPIYGGHYLSDTFAGVLMAALAIVASFSVEHWLKCLHATKWSAALRVPITSGNNTRWNHDRT